MAVLIVTKKLFLFNIFSFTLEKLQRCQVLHKTQGHERVHESEFLEMVAGIKKHVFKFFIGLVTASSMKRAEVFQVGKMGYVKSVVGIN